MLTATIPAETLPAFKENLKRCKYVDIQTAIAERPKAGGTMVKVTARYDNTARGRTALVGMKWPWWAESAMHRAEARRVDAERKRMADAVRRSA